MTQVSASQARQNLPTLLNRAFAGEEFMIFKNKIHLANLVPAGKEKRLIKRRILPGATKLMSHLKGDSVDIVNTWRRREEMRNYGG